MFKNLTLFRLSSQAVKAAIEVPFEDALASKPLRPIGPLEMSTHGFVSPFDGQDDASIVHTVAQRTLFVVGGEHRLLPGSVVNEALRKRVVELERKEDRKVGRKERKALKEEVITDLMPKAFVKPSRARGYLDAKEGWLVLDTSSRKSAENLVTALREALETFPAVPVVPEESPRALMTEWVNTQKLPEGLVLGDACELKDPAGSPSPTARVRNQDLDCDEVREHLKAGKQVSQLALVFEERLSFTLTDELVIKQVKFLEQATEAAAGDETDGAAGELDAQFALAVLEFERLLQALSGWFSLARPIDA